MEGRQFDDLTKALATSTPSRRRMLGGLVGGALAGVFGGVSSVVAGPAEPAVTEPICDNRAVICSQRPAFACGGNGSCFCAKTITGSKRCVDAGGGITCNNREKCERNRDCAAGEFCIDVSGCEDCPTRRGVCFPRCTD